MNQENIGKYIKKLRKENNLSQEKLADKLGVTYQLFLNGKEDSIYQI